MTGPIVLPNYGEQLAEAFKQLGGGLAQIINPHGKDKEAFRRAVAQNPKILQELRDLAEVQGPASVFNDNNAKYIPQDIFDTISSMDASPEAQMRRAGKHAVENMTPEQLTALGLSSVSGMTPIEIQRNLALAPKIAEVAGQAPNEVAPTAAARGAYEAVAGERPQEGAAGVVQGDLIRLAGTYINALPPERRAQLGAYTSLPVLIADEHFMKQLALQEEIWRARNRDRINDTMARLHEQNIIWWQQSTGTGTTDGWEAFFSDKGARRLKQLSGEDPHHPVTKLTDSDRELLEIQRAFQAAPAERRALDLNRVDTGASRLIAAINKESDASVRAAQISALNSLLLNKARITGTDPYHAAWAPGEAVAGVPILNLFKHLRFYDAKNQEVSSSVIDLPPMEAPTNTRGTVSGGPGAGGQTPSPRAQGASGPPSTLAPPPTPRVKTKSMRWDELRALMFPNVRTLTRGQVDSVTARVNAEMGP